MNDLNQNLWDQFIADYDGNYEKLFAGKLWKQSLLPWMKAIREVKLRTVLQSKDHMEIDMARGFVLAIEQIMNLPGAIDASKKKTVKVEVEQSDATDYYDGISWDEV